MQQTATADDWVRLDQGLYDYGHFQMPDKAFKLLVYLLLAVDQTTKDSWVTYQMIRDHCCAPDRPPWNNTTINIALDYLEDNGYIQRIKTKTGAPQRIKVINDGSLLPPKQRMPMKVGRQWPPTIRADVRLAVLGRDKRTCRYCGKKPRQCHLDHVIPWKRGGSSDDGNLVTACQSCNSRKGSRTPEEAGMVLLPVPSSP